MTPEDRDLLVSLRHQQADLRQMLERLNAQLGALEARAAGDPPASPVLPPLPPEAFLPPLPRPAAAPAALSPLPPLPPLPGRPGLHALPPAPPRSAPAPSFEYQFGRWLIRIGAFFGLVILAWILSLPGVQVSLGHAGLLALSGAISVGVVVLGERIERNKDRASLLFGRTIAVVALAWLYLTAYAAYFYEPLRVIGSPLFAGLLLVLWSIYVLLLAERKKSQLLALFALTLAYVGTAINPVGSFTMAADLILAATAMAFLLRRGWTVLSTVSLAGTYLALLRQLVFDENGGLVLDTSRTLPFWPYASYLIATWLIFTTAVIFSTAATFRGGKRLAFLSLNNGALAGLLALTAYIAGYGASAIGWTLLDAGLVFLVTSRFAGFAPIDPAGVMGAYAAQGLALFTAGIIVIYTGMTRGVLLLIETFFLGVAGAFSGDRILTISTYVSAFFATFFLIWEIAINAHHPWMLGFSAAAVMLINAWACRGEIRHSPMARSRIVVSTSGYCVLALALIFTALGTELSASVLPPALALAALALTFSIYYVSLFELPPVSQALLLAAQALVLFPTENGEELPWWSTAWVAVMTLLLLTWWSRQRMTRSGSWTHVLRLLYALALLDLAYQAFRPYVGAQDWMVDSSLLSVAFLIYGAFTRVWSLAAVGQFFLAVALYHFFFPPQPAVFPWAWWAAAAPVIVVFATARAALEWLRVFREIPAPRRVFIALLAYGYQLVALGGLIRWVFAIIPVGDQAAIFLLLGGLIFAWNVRKAGLHRVFGIDGSWSSPVHFALAYDPASFGVRCSFVLSALGLALYVADISAGAPASATLLNGVAIFLLLAQTALLRSKKSRNLVTAVECWAFILLAVGLGWLFVSAWTWIRLTPGYLTMDWALYALFLFLLGLLFHERRLQWCGSAVVVAAILRVGSYDIWAHLHGRVITLVVLALSTFVIGYANLRRSDRKPSAE
jgi:hypothetical protein